MKENRQEILQILGRYRYLFDRLCSNEDIILKDMFDMISYGDIVYPCDVIDLRSVLNELSIRDEDPIALFSIKFAEKYLKRFPIFLVIDEKKLYYSSRDIKGMKLYDGKSIDIHDSLKRIIINEPLSQNVKKTIFGIIKDSNCKVECIVSNSIPGISGINPKLS